MRTLETSLIIFGVGLVVAAGARVAAEGPAPTSSPASAASPSAAGRASTPQPGSMMSPPTASVLAKMHQVNRMEIDLGRVAATNGATRRVRAYGRRLARDHAFADRKVQALARAEKIDLEKPMPVPPGGGNAGMPSLGQERQMEQQNQMMAKLQQANGPEFDQLYLQAMIRGHEQAIAMLEGVESTTGDAGLRHLLSRMVPILHQHLDLARHLAVQEVFRKPEG